MKRSGLFCLILLSVASTGLYAKNNVNNDMFKVNLQNFGSEHCALVQKLIKAGWLYRSDVPSILAATGEQYNFTLETDDNNTGEIILKYACGDHKKFTLHMKQIYKYGKYKHNTLSAEMLDAVDVFEQHKIRDGMHHGSEPGVVSWQITQ